MGFPDVPHMLDGEMGSVLLHWVVQRNAQTGALITFVSFEDYADAESHKAKLEAIADPLGRTNVVAIESLPIAEFPKIEAGRLQLGKPTSR
jgi:molybdopterin-guanine dinucleotide biosynthesis protein